LSVKGSENVLQLQYIENTEMYYEISQKSDYRNIRAHIYFCFRETKLPVLPHTSGPLPDPEGENFRQQALY